MWLVCRRPLSTGTRACVCACSLSFTLWFKRKKKKVVDEVMKFCRLPPDIAAVVHVITFVHPSVNIEDFIAHHTNQLGVPYANIHILVHQTDTPYHSKLKTRMVNAHLRAMTHSHHPASVARAYQLLSDTAHSRLDKDEKLQIRPHASPYLRNYATYQSQHARFVDAPPCHPMSVFALPFENDPG